MRYRVQIGIYAGAFFLCEACLPGLLEHQLRRNVVGAGLRCLLSIWEPPDGSPTSSVFGRWRSLAHIRRREPAL